MFMKHDISRRPVLPKPTPKIEKMFLPSEIKLSVADYLDPQSSINFGVTCKDHWQLCQPLLQRHTEGFAEAPVITAYNALDLLRAAIHDPRKAWYIREISFRKRWDDQFTTPIEDAEHLRDAAKRLSILYPPSGSGAEEEDLTTRIEHGLETGCPESAVAVLLHYLPNLRTIELTTRSEETVLDLLLERIGIEYIDPTKQPSLPLQRLHTIALAHHDTEGCLSPELALPFLRIPSLRIFAAHMMGGDFYHADFEPAAPLCPHPQSNIEEFFFTGCQFNSAALEYLLSCTAKLKRFTYEAGGCCTSDDPYDAKIVLQALAEHAKHSLERLVLGHFMYSEEEVIVRDLHHDQSQRPTEADLSMFTKLTSLSANWAMLWPELSEQPFVTRTDDGGCHESIGMSCTPLDIRDVLPASLENLHLNGNFDKEEWEGVVGPLVVPNEETPKLTIEKIRVDGRVQNRVTRRNEGAICTVGGWDASDSKMVFGHSDNAWLTEAREPYKLFKGHGW